MRQTTSVKANGATYMSENQLPKTKPMKLTMEKQEAKTERPLSLQNIMIKNAKGNQLKTA